jgi:TatD DNase family protein
MIDSHTHQYACKPDDAELVAAAERAGVTRMLTVGTDGATCRESLAAAERFPQVFAAIGRHPNAAAGFDDADLAELRALAAHDRCLAIGETGLDYYRDRAPRADQARAFAAQIDLARETGKPLVIHTREAADDTLAVLRETSCAVILHCFSLPEHLDEVVERGWYLSFAGNVTYPSAAPLAEAAARAPAELLLLETDCPYLSPVPHRGKPNRPRFVLETLGAVAAMRGIAARELAEQVEANAARVFSLP